MINPNNFATPAAQEQGESLWDGQSTAQTFIDNRNNMDMATQRSEPVSVPQDSSSGLNLNGDAVQDNKTNFNDKVPGLKGMVNEQSNKVYDYMKNRNSKNYSAVTGEIKKKDLSKHPEVIAHNEHAERTNN